MDILGPLPLARRGAKFVIMAVNYFTKWIEAKPLVRITSKETSIKQSNEETPFSLTYDSDAVIPAEIGIPTYRTLMISEGYNEEDMHLNLDRLQERRETAAIREARMEDQGKLGPKWERPYRVMEAYANGSYKFQTFKDKEIPRTWHVINLRGGNFSNVLCKMIRRPDGLLPPAD
nr:hypothetical protein [Tanacetum cinerariifolium]